MINVRPKQKELREKILAKYKEGQQVYPNNKNFRDYRVLIEGDRMY